MERIDDLHWGGFRLIQNPDWFCFSLDAVLLAWYTRLHPVDCVLDLGCGNGILPLLFLARQPNLTVTGLELMEPLVDLARRNMALNGVEAKIVCGDIKKAEQLFPKGSFDLVVSNPPYEKATHGRLSPEPLKAAAKTELFCSLNDVAAAAAKLLKPKGRFAIVHRAGRLAEVMAAAKGAGLEPKTLLLTAPRKEAAANLLCMEAVKGGKSGLELLPFLFVYDDKGYSQEMREIFRGPEGEGTWKR